MCTSVNECVCHGIPDSRRLAEGDIVNIDVTVYLNVSSTWPFPELGPSAQGILLHPLLLLHACLQLGAQQCFSGHVMAAQGYHGDTSRMFPVGQVSDKAQHLCNVTLEALKAAVSQCGPNVPVRRIGEVLSVHMPFPIA